MSQEVQVLFREGLADPDELPALREHFALVCLQRHELMRYSRAKLVIGRYSVLPYYDEVEADVKACCLNLANTHREHRWIAGFHWYEPLKEFTPKTWDESEFYRLKDSDGPFILKGETNSKKWQWSTNMFAESWSDAMIVMGRLKDDGHLSDQSIKIRKYIPLKVHEPAVVDSPDFAMEFRFFFWKTQEIASGYYWSTAENIDVPVPPEARALAQKCAEIASDFCTFFVLDVAQTEQGDWILIEVNDGQMSGLSTIDPNHFYKRLAEVVVD